MGEVRSLWLHLVTSADMVGIKECTIHLSRSYLRSCLEVSVDHSEKHCLLETQQKGRPVRWLSSASPQLTEDLHRFVGLSRTLATVFPTSRVRTLDILGRISHWL